MNLCIVQYFPSSLTSLHLLNEQREQFSHSRHHTIAWWVENFVPGLLSTQNQLSALCFRVCNVFLPWQGPGLQGLCDSGFSPMHWSPIRQVTRRRATPSPHDTEHWEISKMVRGTVYLLCTKHNTICLSTLNTQKGCTIGHNQAEDIWC